MTPEAVLPGTPPSLADLQGGWRRVSLRLGDEAPFECQDVLWLQVGEHFADLRVRNGPEDLLPASAFAGVVGVDPPAIDFVHQVDLADEPAHDRAELSWRGPDLVERGVVDLDGVEVSFEEVWRRVEGGEGSVVAGEVPYPGRTVVVGRHAIALVDGRGVDRGFSAARFEWQPDEGRWRVVAELGDGAPPAPPARPDDERRLR